MTTAGATIHVREGKTQGVNHLAFIALCLTDLESAISGGRFNNLFVFSCIHMEKN